jgi:uracil-DNA glycosylase family 4
MNEISKKQKLLDELYAPYRNCLQCPLGFLGRKNVVFGSGNPDASLVLIGEGPGEQEDIQGKPFVGKSGALLTKILDTIGLTREEIFITNIVKCRPPHNRTPLPHEMSGCKKLLLEKQMNIIRPQVICTLGAAALQGLCGIPLKITRERGIPRSLMGITTIPTYHPAYILRNPSKLHDLVNDLAAAHTLVKSNKDTR